LRFLALATCPAGQRDGTTWTRRDTKRRPELKTLEDVIMRLGHWILFFHLLLLTRYAGAETIDLACVHREYGIKLHFKVDTVKNSVMENGVLAREVYIDKTTISFIIDLTSGQYFHYISRSSGNMTVKAPDGTLIYGYECDTAKAKF
jgi:hypothetical protein